MRRRLLALALAASTVPMAAVVIDPGEGGAGGLGSSFQLNTAESYVGGLVNGTRIQYGVRVAYTEATAAQCARNNSIRNGQRGGLPQHSTEAELQACLPNAVEIAENVGSGPSLNTMHQAMLSSSVHRANLLDSGWVYQGPGVYRDSAGTYWLTEIFWR